MANTPNYNLYKPNRLDSVAVDFSLSDNFTIIDTEIKNANNRIDNVVIEAAGLKPNIVEEFTATEGQTVFNLANSYPIGTGNVDVEIDGVTQQLGENFTETNSTRITLNEGVIAGAEVRVIIKGLNEDTRITMINNQLAEKVKKGELFINVKDYGATGDGVTNDTLAVKDAIAAAEANRRTLIFPAGEYLLDDTLVVTDTTFQGEGQGRTKLVFINMGVKDGISITPNEIGATVGVYHMSILVKGGDGGSAIKTQDHSQQYQPNRTKYEFEDLMIGGYTEPITPLGHETVESWTVCLDIGDSFGTGIREVFGRGNFRIDQDPTGQLQSIFLKMQGNSTVMTVHADGLVASAFYRGIEVGDKSFFLIQKFDLVHCYDGVYQTASSSTVFDESKLLNGNINAQRYGVYFSDVGSRQIDGVIVRRHRKGWKTASNNWYGFYLNNVSLSWITDCHAQPDETEGTYLGTQIGIICVGVGLTTIHGFVAGSTLDEGIRYDNCTGMVTSNTVSAQGTAVGATAKVFNLINNTRSSQFGIYSLVSTFTGTVYTADGSINKTTIKLVTTANLP